MSKSDTFEANFLDLIFLGTGIANLADNAAASPATSLYLSFHSADPGEGGDQTTSEATYAGYARVAVARSAAGFVRTGSIVSLVADAVFPACSGGAAQTLRYAGLGTAASGAGKLLYSGVLDGDIVVQAGVTPFLEAGTSFSED